MRHWILFKPFLLCGFLWCRQGEGSETPSHYWQVRWKSKIPRRPSLTPEEGFPHYGQAKVGLSALHYTSTGISLTGRVTSASLLFPMWSPLITAGDGTSLRASGDGSPNSPLHLPWHHPRRVGAHHYSLVRVKSRPLLLWVRVEPCFFLLCLAVVESYFLKVSIMLNKLPLLWSCG